MKQRVWTEEEKQRWLDEMPVLAAIYSRMPDRPIGEFVRSTAFGNLYLDGQHYSLVKGPRK
jgi:hypothetical protein